ncbi:Amidohydrolase family protein [compost metagenome]
MGPYFEAPAIQAAHGAEAAQASPPTRLALQKGLMVAGGTDSTRVGVINVWRAIEYHVTGRAVGGAVQRRADHLLTREEALRLYTANAAWLAFSEPHRGSLAVGKLADFAVLDAPFLTVAPDAIHKIRSVLTFVDGKPVHVAPRHGAALPPRTDARVLKAIGHLHDHGDDAAGAPPRH